MNNSPPAIKRFLSRIVISDDGCWESTYTPLRNGYCHISIGGEFVLIHRFIYEYYNGGIDQTLTVNHKCENRKCCNPIHLEQITSGENLHYSWDKHGHPQTKKTHCPQGHEYAGDNLYVDTRGFRECRTCRRLRWQKEVLVV